MTDIIDIHSHILPELDDGASDMQESIQMLRLAWQQGIGQVIATPHYSGGFQNACPEKIRSLCQEVQVRARSELKAEISIWPGQEIMYSEDVPGLLEEGRLLTMADSRYVLVEFLPAVSYSYIFHAVKELVYAGYRPILAHAERYQALREDGKLEELKKQGACVQLNFRPIGGKWYHETARWCRKMLKREITDFLGTDMHNTTHRKPETEKAVMWMEKELRESYMRSVLRANALELLRENNYGFGGSDRAEGSIHGKNI